MADLALVRVDGRLIHGATCLTWGNAVSATMVIGIDNITASNPMLKKITEAVVKNIPCKVMTVEQAVAKWRENRFGEGRALVVFKTIEQALKANKEGFDFNTLQIGLTLARSGTKRLGDTFFINQSDIDMLTELAGRGVEIYTQYNPQFAVESWEVSIKAKF